MLGSPSMISWGWRMGGAREYTRKVGHAKAARKHPGFRCLASLLVAERPVRMGRLVLLRQLLVEKGWPPLQDEPIISLRRFSTVWPVR